jgi:hypothetical protein
MQTRTSLVFAKGPGREEKTPLLHSLRSAVLVCLDTTRFVRDGMTTGDNADRMTMLRAGSKQIAAHHADGLAGDDSGLRQ